MSSVEFTAPLRVEINDLEQSIVKMKTEIKFLKKENKLLREVLKEKETK